MSRILLWVVAGYLLQVVQAETGDIRPQELSVSWNNDFEPVLTWTPRPLEHCMYRVSSNRKRLGREQRFELAAPPLISDIAMEGGYLEFSVEPVCNGTSGEPTRHVIDYPELVEKLQCFMRSSSQSQCSWQPTSQSHGVRFFYWLVDENMSITSNDTPTIQIQECSSYTHTDGVRTGCDVQTKAPQSMLIMFNGTRNNTLVERNTYSDTLLKVKPPPLNWTVVKSEKDFKIDWIPPDILGLSRWSFIINYTECDTVTSKTIQDETSTRIHRAPHCQYSMSIKAWSSDGETPWSDIKHFDALTNPKPALYAVFLIPLLFAGLSVLTFVYCRKNKEKLFRKVPKPFDFFSGISDMNSESLSQTTSSNLLVPEREEEICKITMVIDHQHTDPDFSHVQATDESLPCSG